MIAIIENIGIALMVAGALTFVAYFIVSQIKRGWLGMAHYVGLGVLFLLFIYQSYKFMDAWDEKSAIEEALDGINSFADNAIEFAEELDKQNGGNGQTGQQIKDAISNPLVQKGLIMFGLNVGVNGQITVEMGERLKSEYNKYMFKRACWILGFMAAYVIISLFLSSPGLSSGHHSRSSERTARHSSRIRRS